MAQHFPKSLKSKQGIQMKSLLTFTALAFTFSTALLAQQVLNAKEFIHLEECFDTTGSSELGACVDRQVELCWYATGGINVTSGQCKSEAYRQADNLLNQYYQQLVPAMRSAANQWVGSGYEIEGNPLRESQRAWLTVRDTTCNLAVLYGAVMSGRDSTIDGCKARLTMQRIGDLSVELGFYLDASN